MYNPCLVFTLAEGDINPVCHFTPDVHKDAFDSLPLQLVACCCIVADKWQLCGFHVHFFWLSFSPCLLVRHNHACCETLLFWFKVEA